MYVLYVCLSVCVFDASWKVVNYQVVNWKLLIEKYNEIFKSFKHIVIVISLKCVSDILDVLKDLDETSKRKVDILEHFLVR